MLVHQHVHPHRELVKWFILLTLASAFAMLSATVVGGTGREARVRSEPAALPPKIDSWSTTIEEWECDNSELHTGTAMAVWDLLELHKSESYAEAIEGWKRIELPDQTAIWREISIAQAYLATGDKDSAAVALERAAALRPDHSIVYYYTAILRLEQAHLAEEWFDAVGPWSVRFAETSPLQIVPNTRSMYELAAMQHLESCIRTAGEVWMDEPLLPTDWPSQTAVEPTVGDLLLALGADRYVARAHHTLGAMYLERFVLETAEDHFDKASAGGIVVVFGYQDLADQYQSLGRNRDAFRANLKAMREGPNRVSPGRDAWESLRRTWWETL